MIKRRLYPKTSFLIDPIDKNLFYIIIDLSVKLLISFTFMVKSFIFLGLTVLALAFISLCAWLFSMPDIYPIALPCAAAIVLIEVFPITLEFRQNWKESLFKDVPLFFLLFAFGVGLFWVVGTHSTFLFPPLNDGIAVIYGILVIFTSFSLISAVLVLVHLVALISSKKGWSCKTSCIVLCNLLIASGMQVLTLYLVQHICGA